MNTQEILNDTPREFHGYTIHPLTHPTPGFFIKGKFVTKGWGVSKDGVNVIPGAIWFTSVGEAKKGIAALELAKRIAYSNEDEAKTFWLILELNKPDEDE